MEKVIDYLFYNLIHPICNKIEDRTGVGIEIDFGDWFFIIDYSPYFIQCTKRLSEWKYGYRRGALGHGYAFAMFYFGKELADGEIAE